MDRPTSARWDGPASRLAAHRTRAAARLRGIALRTNVVLLGFALLFMALGARGIWLTALPNVRLSSALRSQQGVEVTLHPMRGSIVDRAGRDLAVSVREPSVFADPRFFAERGGDPKDAAARLSPLLDVPEGELRARLTQGGRFVWLARLVPDDVAQRVEALKIPGVRVTDEYKRRYPNGALAGQLLGFTGADGRGLEGLEGRYDQDLRGEERTLAMLRDGRRRNITPDGVLVKQASEGDSLVLTLDRNIQFAAERALQDAVLKWDARGGFVLVMDVQTGAILATASAPAVDPNVFGRFDRETYRNLPLSFNYEPGSVMKIFLVASALEDGTVTPDTMFFCEFGNYAVGRKIVHDTHPYGDMDVRSILKVSSNIGSTKIGQRMGKERLWDWYRQWGFGRATGVELPGESGGILRDVKTWYPIDLATHAFGQGVSVTGIQTATALAAIANGGRLMRPYIVDEVRDREGRVVRKTEPTEVRRVLCDSTAAEVRAMMATVLDEGGTGTLARLDAYSAAGKTGTAQKVNPATGLYQFWVGSFVGFAPAEDPRVAIVVSVDEPKKHHYGGVVAGPVFREVGRQALVSLGVPALPERLARLPVAQPSVPGSGSEAPQAPQPPEQQEAMGEAGGAGAAPDAPGGPPDAMPDLKGVTAREAIRRLAGISAAVRVEGTGLLSAQSPPPGTPLAGAAVVTLTFTPPPRPAPPALPPGQTGSVTAPAQPPLAARTEPGQAR